MWLRIVGGFAMATALPLAPSAQAQPSPIAVKTDKSWTHKPSGIAFPSKVDGFARNAVEDLSNGALLDTSIAYDDPISRTHVNVYVYHAAMPATAIWFDVASTPIEYRAASPSIRARRMRAAMPSRSAIRAPCWSSPETR